MKSDIAQKAGMLSSGAVRRFLEAGVSPSTGAGEDEQDDFS